MNLENALKITDGWCEQNDLEWLAVHASQSKLIAEVGSWHGRSTTCLADNTEGIVFAIDTWEGSEEHRGSTPVDDFQRHCQRAYDSFHTNMKPYIDRGKVIPVHMPSVDAAIMFKALQAAGYPAFDMVFIDGNHEYDFIKADLLAWKPLVRGLFCGHDAGHSPVERAVQEVFPNRPLNECSMWRIIL